jgi:hypothetical protein
VSLSAGLVAATAHGALAQDEATYRVTITNLTRAQRFTPLLVVTHASGVRVFAPGTQASGEVRAMAEEGDLMPLMALLRGVPLQVRDMAATRDLLTPAVTAQLDVRGGGRYDRLSFVSMLIPTNDGFVGLNSVRLPTGFDPMVVDAVAYDAGTERNDERCASIPGPGFAECNGPGGGARVGGGEGAVTVHNGIHGVGDFRAADRDWRNPVARVTIQRVQ